MVDMANRDATEGCQTGHGHREQQAETAPLLSPGLSGVDEQNRTSVSNAPRKDGFPKLQVVVLCLATMVDPISYFGIFPYIGEMIERNGHVKMTDVGLYAGVIEGLFSLVETMFFLPYGRMADKVGRKPVLVFSLMGIGICNALFGLSHNLWQMVLFRCLAGTFAGSSVTVRAMLSEITTKETQGKAFSWFMFTRFIGIFLGPIIGGTLADPVARFPSVFARSSFFSAYPYALSGFATSAMAITVAFICLLFLRETLDRKAVATQPSMSTWQILKSPGILRVLGIYGHVFLLAPAHLAVLPLSLYTDIAYGGFSFPPQSIAYVLAILGTSQALWMLFAFPPLQRRYGAAFILRCTAIGWPLFISGHPYGNELLRRGLDTTLLWTGIPIIVIGSGISMAFTCVQLCINDVSPSPSELATVNALALTLTSAIRAVVPILATSLFAAGVKLRFADGHSFWIVFIPICAALSLTVRILPSNAGVKVVKAAADEEADDER